MTEGPGSPASLAPPASRPASTARAACRDCGQGLDRLLAHVQAHHAVLDGGDLVYRDCHLAPSPEMSFLQDEVGDRLGCRGDEEGIDVADVPIGSLDPVTTAHRQFVWRDGRL